MKTLTDLAKEWKKNLCCFYVGEKDIWQIGFFPATIEGSEAGESPWGEGVTLSQAIANYAQIIRGKTLNFGSLKYPELYRVPEILTS